MKANDNATLDLFTAMSLPPVPFVAPPSGKQQRDAGIAKVLKTEQQWQEAALRLLEAYAIGVDSFTVEDFRAWALHRLYQQPHHSNAWGALVRTAALRRIIVKTGVYVQATDPAARARIVALWRKG